LKKKLAAVDKYYLVQKKMEKNILEASANMTGTPKRAIYSEFLFWDKIIK
jgi:hypothetical protein